MRKQDVVQCVSYTIILLLFVVSAYSQSANDLYTAGVNYYKNKQFDSAISVMNRLIRMTPNNAAAYTTRGNAYYSKRMYETAFQDYSKSLSIKPNEISYFNRGNLYNAKRMTDSAISDFMQSISINPNYSPAYLGLGIAHNNKKMYEQAIQDLNSAINLDTNSTYTFNSRGINYLYTGQYELAINDFRRGIALDKAHQAAYAIINIIEPLARMHRFAEAAKYYNDFRTNYLTGYIDHPYWAFYRKYLEVVSKDLVNNNYEVALQNLQQAEQLYNIKSKTEGDNDSQKRGYSSILALKGYVLEKMGSQDAKQAYEQSLLINPNDPQITAALQQLSDKKDRQVLTDNAPPVIKILEPVIDTRSISVEDDKPAGFKQHIRGQAIDPSGIRKVLLNNAPLKVEDNGYFDTLVTINEGVNVFTIVATDRNANAISQTIQLNTGKGKSNLTLQSISPDSALLHASPVYNAVLIAESDYADKNIPTLQGPVSDMTKIYNLLVKNYGFAASNTDTLINPTRNNILEAIIKKANAMGENDNLFIFYAGHGQMITQPDKTEEGFLVPQDAVKDMISTYISSDDLMRTIKYSKAKHILFVADACFAGSLFRDIPSEAPIPVSEAYKDKSRRLLASGNRTAVPDKSEFIEFLRLALQENRSTYITAEQLIDSFKERYTSETHLTLQYYPIKNVDDLGGQFVFIRK